MHLVQWYHPCLRRFQSGLVFLLKLKLFKTFKFVSANFCRLVFRRKVRFLPSILKALFKFSNSAGIFVTGVFCAFLQSL